MNKQEILQAIDNLHYEASKISESSADKYVVTQAYYAGIRHVLCTMEKINELINCNVSSDDQESSCHLEVEIDPVRKFLQGHGTYQDNRSVKIELYCESIKESHILETMKNLGFTITPTKTESQA